MLSELLTSYVRRSCGRTELGLRDDLAITSKLSQSSHPSATRSSRSHLGHAMTKGSKRRKFERSRDCVRIINHDDCGHISQKELSARASRCDAGFSIAQETRSRRIWYSRKSCLVSRQCLISFEWDHMNDAGLGCSHQSCDEDHR